MSEQSPGLDRDEVGQALVPRQQIEEVVESTPIVDTRPNFSDFAGLDQEISQLKEFGAIFNNAELAQQWDVEVPTGLLLCGPGGVGKTELVRAFSKEIDAELLEVAVSDVQSMWVGKSNEQLKEVFQEARLADSKVVVFFDELDGLFSKNAGGNSGVSTALISELKTILSQLRVKQPNTIVAASTNSLSGFDEALLRPGRFDVVLQISKPNDSARASIFGSYISRKYDLYNLGEVGVDSRAGGTIDLPSLAAATEGMTGADIKAILHSARTKRLMAHIQRGVELTAVTQDDILLAIRHHRQQRPNATD
ncbi:MAG: ATP-binding protein [Patescibacteria group bacterium]|nr:ATP-binding protein [Patescibacteria group bacterium]